LEISLAQFPLDFEASTENVSICPPRQELQTAANFKAGVIVFFDVRYTFDRNPSRQNSAKMDGIDQKAETFEFIAGRICRNETSLHFDRLSAQFVVVRRQAEGFVGEVILRVR
jgi:hypothetical protein